MSNFDVLRSVVHGHNSIDVMDDGLLKVNWQVVADFYQKNREEENKFVHWPFE